MIFRRARPQAGSSCALSPSCRVGSGHGVWSTAFLRDGGRPPPLGFPRDRWAHGCPLGRLLSASLDCLRFSERGFVIFHSRARKAQRAEQVPKKMGRAVIRAFAPSRDPAGGLSPSPGGPFLGRKFLRAPRQSPVPLQRSRVGDRWHGRPRAGWGCSAASPWRRPEPWLRLGCVGCSDLPRSATSYRPSSGHYSRGQSSDTLTSPSL